MRVVGFLAPGGPEVLAVHDVPQPHAGPGEVRIAVRAAAVNPTDVSLREGRRGTGELPPPHVPGMDAAGVIDEVGPATADGDTSPWRVGDEVMAMAIPLVGHGGAYVEFLVADADSIARMPSGRTFVEAATLPMNGLTAMQALDLLELPVGATVAVTGAAGTLGGYVVQLATQRGLRVLADAGPADYDTVLSFGADRVVERGDDVARRFRALAPDGVDGLVDCAVLDDRALPAVRDGGRLVSVRCWPGIAGHPVTVRPVWVFDEYHQRGRLDHLRESVENGTLTLRVAGSLPFGEAPEAHRRLAAGGLRGRLVLVP